MLIKFLNMNLNSFGIKFFYIGFIFWIIYNILLLESKDK